MWSVALIDLVQGNRTPMLVDALEDCVPIWCLGDPLPRLPFTRLDAVRCAGAILDRLSEGRLDFAIRLDRGDRVGAARRARDDIVRACTGLLLLQGVTRPRRAEAVRRLLTIEAAVLPPDPDLRVALAWAVNAFGPRGDDEHFRIPTPPLPPRALVATIDRLRMELSARLAGGTSLAPLPPR